MNSNQQNDHKLSLNLVNRKLIDKNEKKFKRI